MRLSKLISSRAGMAALAVLAILVLSIAVSALRAFPGRRIVMATGPPGSSYAIMAERYRYELARDGVQLELRPSTGAIKNIALLDDPNSGVDVAFGQPGMTSERASPEVQSLGTMFYEPLWFFCRCDGKGRGLLDLPGPRMSIGEPGSGTRALAMRLLTLTTVKADMLDLRSYPPQEAARRLQAGELDGAVILTGWESPVIRELLSDPMLSLISFPRADAYVALVPILHKVRVPRGIGNLGADRPPADVYLLASKASLLIRRDLHPAFQFLLLRASRDIQARAGLFNTENEFPAAEEEDVPLSDEAESFYKSGPNALQRYLPFWLAALVERLLILMIPVVGLAYPLWSALPKLYRWQMRRRILPLYAELFTIERRARSAHSTAEWSELLGRMDLVERRAAELRVPRDYGEMAYELKTNVKYVRDMLRTDVTSGEREPRNQRGVSRAIGPSV